MSLLLARGVPGQARPPPGRTPRDPSPRARAPRAAPPAAPLAPVVDVSGILAGGPAPPELLAAVRAACASTGFLCARGHGVDLSLVARCMDLGEAFFAQPRAAKEAQGAVGDMTSGRGYEISPEHRRFADEFAVRYPDGLAHPEWSAREGILSERFMVGPEVRGQTYARPLALSPELDRRRHRPPPPPLPQEPEGGWTDGRMAVPDAGAFFAPNRWPAGHPGLREAMLALYGECESLSAALMGLFAEALGERREFFEPMLRRHHSNLQVASYPSQAAPVPDGARDLRKKAHVDSGTLTLLFADDWMPGSAFSPERGGLELQLGDGSWQRCDVPAGSVLVNLGTVATVLTNGEWRSTVHRVANPDPGAAGDSLRRSVAFFHKPDPAAVVGPVAATVGPGRPARFAPRPVAELTRQGVIAKHRHLGAEAASLKYHEFMREIRDAQGP